MTALFPAVKCNVVQFPHYSTIRCVLRKSKSAILVDMAGSVRCSHSFTLVVQDVINYDVVKVPKMVVHIVSL